MSQNNFDYYSLQRDNAIKKINEEIAFYEETPLIIHYTVNEYLLYLKNNRLGINRNFVATGPVVLMDKMGNRKEVHKMNMDEYAKDIVEESFRKPWNKLRPVHKMMKITEYVSNLKFKNKISADKIDENKNFILSEIEKGMKEKKFLKGGSVITYDETALKIKSISCIVFNKKKGIYQIDWDL